MRLKVTPPRAFAALALVLHLFFASWQGYFTDEAYFIDCANHPAWGYFDIGPLLPFLIRVSRAVFGPSLTAFRLAPALGHAGTVLLGGMIAAELGGSLFAQSLACTCILLAPGFLVLGGLFITPSLEPFFWTLSCYLVLLILNRKRPELWPWAGLSMGLGFLNKPAFLLLPLALLPGLLASPSRGLLKTRSFAAGIVAALVAVSPNLVWQLTHDWNTIVFARSIAGSSLVRQLDGLTFVLAPVFALGPLTAVVWVAGALYLGLSSGARHLRAFGYLLPLALLALWLGHGKPYYAAGAYPLLLAAGSVWLEKVSRTPQARAAFLAVYALSGLALVPAGLPLFSGAETERYLAAISMGPVSLATQSIGIRMDTEGKARELFLANLARIYSRIPESERAGVRILTSHYFQASWINYFGEKYGLPRAVSGNNTYYLWGPGAQSGEITLAVGFDDAFLKAAFETFEPAPEEATIKIARHPRVPIEKLWPDLRSFPF